MMVIATECRKGAARVKFENPLDVRVMAIDGTWCRDCQLIDVSETGAQIRLTGPAVNDTEFFLLLTKFGDPVFRSFITRLGPGQNTTAIVNAMVGLAHNLSMSIVAEGVETQAQAEFLKAIGCDAAQGYLFARPVPAGVAVQQLQDPHRLPDF